QPAADESDRPYLDQERAALGLHRPGEPPGCRPAGLGATGVPLYDYVAAKKGCRKCKGGFEVFQKLAEPKLKKCPACKAPIERVISAVPVHGKYSTKSDSRIKD